MQFITIDSLILAVFSFRDVRQVNDFITTHAETISTLMNQLLPADRLNYKSIVKLFNDNGYPIDKVIAQTIGENTRNQRDRLKKEKHRINLRAI